MEDDALYNSSEDLLNPEEEELERALVRAREENEWLRNSTIRVSRAFMRKIRQYQIRVAELEMVVDHVEREHGPISPILPGDEVEPRAYLKRDCKKRVVVRVEPALGQFNYEIEGVHGCLQLGFFHEFKVVNRPVEEKTLVDFAATANPK